MIQSTTSDNNGKLQPYLSPLAVWALSVGSSAASVCLYWDSLRKEELKKGVQL